MARAPSVCNTQRCPNEAVAKGRCEQHQPEAWAGSTRSKRLPRGWQRIRAAVLHRDGYACVQCGAAATEVDHIEHGDNHDMDNLQALCHACHERKTLSEAARGRHSQ